MGRCLFGTATGEPIELVLIARADGGVAEPSSKAGCLAITAAIMEI